MIADLHEHHLTVARTARYYTIGRPHAEVRDVWIACHGFGQLASRFLRHFTALASPRRLIVAPEALSRYYIDSGPGIHGPHSQVGATWMTREDRLSEISDYVGYLDALYDQLFAELDRTRVTVTVLGFSQGVATVTRWLTAGRARADRMIMWGGALPHDIDLAAARDRLAALDLTIVNGREDTLLTHETVQALAEQLDRHGIPHRRLEFIGGHRLDDELLASLAVTPG